MDVQEQSPFDASYSGSENQPPSDDEPVTTPQRLKRMQVKNACINCQSACKKCDNNRPCNRCIKQGLTSSCEDSKRKPRQRGIKRGPYKKRKKKDEQFPSTKTRCSKRIERRNVPKIDPIGSPIFSRDSSAVGPSYGQFSPQWSPEQVVDSSDGWNGAADMSQERRIFRLPPIGGFEECYRHHSPFDSQYPETPVIDTETSLVQESPLNMLSDVALTEKTNAAKEFLYTTPLYTPLPSYRLGYIQSNRHIPLSNARFDEEYRSPIPPSEKKTRPDYKNPLVDSDEPCRENGQMTSYSSDMLYECEQSENNQMRRLSQLLDKAHISRQPGDNNDVEEDVEVFRRDLTSARQNTHASYDSNVMYTYGHHPEEQLGHHKSLSGYEIS